MPHSGFSNGKGILSVSEGKGGLEMLFNQVPKADNVGVWPSHHLQPGFMKEVGSGSYLQKNFWALFLN